ncbi:hypothetical protein [Streptomyces pactum]|uniref:hypothetical protein n=1 Tax=Streptomyces pactum TaxID=68249 RepID=UPI0036F8DD28
MGGVLAEPVDVLGEARRDAAHVDQVSQETAEGLCRVYADDPQALADALVAAAEGEKDQETGQLRRDDATVVALRRPTI